MYLQVPWADAAKAFDMFARELRSNTLKRDPLLLLGSASTASSNATTAPSAAGLLAAVCL
jgi:hypothetical protein